MVSDADLAVDAARRAGDLLLDIRAGASGGAAGPGVSSARTGRAAVDAADVRSDRLLAEILSQARPDDAILSEEIASTGDRSTARRVWIIDPLDGTREYGEPGRDDWAVHVALWQDGALVTGAVALPGRGEIWTTKAPPSPGAERPIRAIAVSRSRPPAWAVAVAVELGAEVVPMGSAGAKVAAVMRGDVDAYFHDGGQYEWDSAAPVVVARAHGYLATRADGSELSYNQPDPYLPDLVVCPPSAAPDVFARIARHRNIDPSRPVDRKMNESTR